MDRLKLKMEDILEQLQRSTLFPGSSPCLGYDGRTIFLAKDAYLIAMEGHICLKIGLIGALNLRKDLICWVAMELNKETCYKVGAMTMPVTHTLGNFDYEDMKLSLQQLLDPEFSLGKFADALRKMEAERTRLRPRAEFLLREGLVCLR